MDIADIRKKAKAGRRSPPPLPPAAVSREELSPREPVPVLPATAVALPESALVAPEAVVPVVIAATASVATVQPVSRHPAKAVVASSLDELFDLIPDLDLATEAGYQHGLDRHRDESDEEQRRFLTFSLGQEEYGLDITHIREIIKPREITDIPRVPGFLLGIISLRGSIIPIFDLKSRLKLGSGSMTPEARIVVCFHGQRTAGLLVDRITQVVSLPATKIEPPPAVLSGLDRDLVEGVGRHDGKMMILLQMASVLNAELT